MTTMTKIMSNQWQMDTFSTTTGELESRISKLEKRNRRHRRIRHNIFANKRW